jgi:hypothetical protein
MIEFDRVELILVEWSNPKQSSFFFTSACGSMSGPSIGKERICSTAHPRWHLYLSFSKFISSLDRVVFVMDNN